MTDSGYASIGGRHIAYRADGAGPDLLCVAGALFSFDVLHEQPRAASFHRRLAEFCRVIQYDLRGVGRSDPVDVGTPLSVDGMARDALAVLDALAVERATVMSEGGVFSHIALSLATIAPERVASLVLVNSTARLVATDDYRAGHPPEMVAGYLDENIDPGLEWAHPDGEQDEIALMVPSLKDDLAFRDWWVSGTQRSASPATATAILGTLMAADSRDLLDSIEAPAVVLHRRDSELVPLAQGRYLADHLPAGRLVELPAADDVVWTVAADTVVDQVQELMTGRRRGRSERVVLTVLITDIVDSTRTAAQLGDLEWRAVLETHDSIVRRELDRFDGREVNTTGDGFVATFTSPTQAVRAADAIREAAARARVDIRTGLHTGECEQRGDDLAGLAVHLASRVASSAGPREVRVSRTVRDLVAGSGIRFSDLGEHELKGIPDRWQLFRLESATGGDQPGTP